MKDYCPNCSEHVEFEVGVLLDARTGMRGFGCPECNRGWTSSELKVKLDQTFGRPEGAL